MAASNTPRRKMPTAITVVNLQKRIPLKIQPILKAARIILRHEGIRAGELSIVFVTDSRIKSLNKKYLNENHPTDVLSFPNALVGNPDETMAGPPTKITALAGSRYGGTFGGDNFGISPKQISGEIIISTETAVKNARVYHTTPRREILLYVVHGILHLLGYDDQRASDIRKMRRKEQALLNLISK